MLRNIYYTINISIVAKICFSGIFLIRSIIYDIIYLIRNLNHTYYVINNYIGIKKYIFQEVSNQLAKLAIRACARLGGYLNGEMESPENPAVRKSICAMITPYLARKLTLDKPTEVRKLQRILYHIIFCMPKNVTFDMTLVYVDFI